MSPFHETPELWLTSHIQRLHKQEQAIKIQAVARGFLGRARAERRRKAKAKAYKQSLSHHTPSHPITVAEFLSALYLQQYAQNLPTAEEALQKQEASDLRHEAIWNASIVLRFTGRAKYIEQLQWADYHERHHALQNAIKKPEKNKTIWERFTEWLLA